MIGHMISVPLIADASANDTSSMGGAFTFSAGVHPSNAWWNDGSANKFSLLVRVLEILLPLVALLHFTWSIFRLKGRTGAAVPL